MPPSWVVTLRTVVTRVVTCDRALDAARVLADWLLTEAGLNHARVRRQLAGQDATAAQRPQRKLAAVSVPRS